jgi:hypothetical protein
MRGPVATLNHLIWYQVWVPPGFLEGDSMPDIIQTVRARRAFSIVPPELPAFLSDDECLERLARAIAAPDPARLDEVAQLIGRLAVTIE